MPDNDKTHEQNRTHYYCVFDSSERYIVWAENEAAARKLCIADTGRVPNFVLTGQSSVSATPIVADQKRLFGIFPIAGLVCFAWYVIIEPLFGALLPLPLDGKDLLLNGFSHGILLAGAQVLNVFALTVLILATYGDPRFSGRLHFAALNGLIAALIGAFIIAFTDFGAGQVFSDSNQVIGFAYFFLVAYTPISALVTGRFLGVVKGDHFKPLITAMRRQPYLVEFLALAGLPAIVINAEIARQLLLIPIELIRSDLSAGGLGLGTEVAVLFLIVWGIPLFALLLYPAYTIDIHSIQQGILDRTLQRRPKFIKPFYSAYLFYLVSLLLNIAFPYIKTIIISIFNPT